MVVQFIMINAWFILYFCVVRMMNELANINNFMWLICDGFFEFFGSDNFLCIMFVYIVWKFLLVYIWLAFKGWPHINRLLQKKSITVFMNKPLLKTKKKSVTN
jgi:hypothetical protein